MFYTFRRSVFYLLRLINGKQSTLLLIVSNVLSYFVHRLNPQTSIHLLSEHPVSDVNQVIFYPSVTSKDLSYFPSSLNGRPF